jgi:hypothetical protein
MKSNKGHEIIREYAKKLSDDELRYLNIRLTQRIGGDIAEAVECIQSNQEMDRWLSGASSASDFFDMVDQVDGYIQQEVKRRFFSYEQKEKAAKV